MRKVYTALNLPEAHLMLHMLRHAGIDARVFNENAASVMGEIPVTSAMPEVWVMDAAYEARAGQIISAFNQKVPTGGVQFCAACGEQNPEEFEICWNCGLAFPATE